MGSGESEKVIHCHSMVIQ